VWLRNNDKADASNADNTVKGESWRRVCNPHFISQIAISENHSLRYVSINGQLRKMLLVVKMRGGPHSIDLWEYRITDKGVVLGEPLRGFRALTSGIPGPWALESGEQDPETGHDRAATRSRRSK
jgi:hypothetical protein